MMLNVVFKSGTVLKAEIDDEEIGPLTNAFDRVQTAQHATYVTPQGAVVWSSACGPTLNLVEVVGFAPDYDYVDADE